MGFCCLKKSCIVEVSLMCKKDRPIPHREDKDFMTSDVVYSVFLYNLISVESVIFTVGDVRYHWM